VIEEFRARHLAQPVMEEVAAEETTEAGVAD
jgi:hypothetical protein